ncbi:uncharacterized protein F5891DRAFT_1052361 [Suillus fuscotomentosus]|uniref:Uncharacterized protein n=1 Tax=Suillus fuscotomentosus TaxID=1912939 RepID=A0AAD4DZL6_9AGAM|nr:uncharacterized protein F5891DRAFT_1052361 [Suillus fuscotomentosus]KAG1896825.1 hypothetical protein F5891DRAFT_1052361 [Suillus fuscotomentosus]
MGLYDVLSHPINSLPLLPKIFAKPQQDHSILPLHPVGTRHTRSTELELAQAHTMSPDHQLTSSTVIKQWQKSGRPVLAILCTLLHIILVLLHVVILVLNISGIEHRLVVPLTSGNEIWVTILSTSSQAFYAIYCTILVYLMQRLTFLKNMMRRQTVTALHDTVNAWKGLGSALECLWQQSTIPASRWSILSITAYLACVFSLHVVSSSIIQLQTFNSTVDASATKFSYWPSPGVDMMAIQWHTISASVPTLGRFANLQGMGLYGATLYDIIQSTDTPGRAIVNASSFRANCGLVRNAMLNYSPEINADSFGYFTLNPPMPNLSHTVKFRARLVHPYSDEVVISPTISSFFPGPTVAFIVSTAVNSSNLPGDETVQHVYWEHPRGPGVYISDLQSPLISDMYDVHIVACTIDVQPRAATVDVQTNRLLDLSPSLELNASGEWEAWSVPEEEPKWDIWSPPSASVLHHEKWLVSPFAGGAHHPVGRCMNQHQASCYGFSLLEVFFMQEIGIDVVFRDPKWTTTTVLVAPPTIPKQVLGSRDQFESALSRAYAAVLWTGGQLGADGGGFDRKNENTTISQQILQWHLGINLWPLAFALTCSLLMLALSMRVTNGMYERNYTMPINSAGILQIMWLTTNRFRVLRDLASDVEDPQEDILRAAGMVDVDLLRELDDVQVGDC